MPDRSRAVRSLHDCRLAVGCAIDVAWLLDRAIDVHRPCQMELVHQTPHRSSAAWARATHVPTHAWAGTSACACACLGRHPPVHLRMRRLAVLLGWPFASPGGLWVETKRSFSLLLALGLLWAFPGLFSGQFCGIFSTARTFRRCASWVGIVSKF